MSIVVIVMPGDAHHSRRGRSLIWGDHDERVGLNIVVGAVRLVVVERPLVVARDLVVIDDQSGIAVAEHPVG